MMLKKVTTQVTYKVPTGCECNLSVHGSMTKVSTERCRFCVKGRGNSYVCALYNESLDVSMQTLVNKCDACKKATSGYKSIVEDANESPEPTVSPKTVVKTAINEYIKAYKSFIKQGYPDAIAEKLAKEYLIGGR